MSEELRQKIESVDSKNTQQFVPTLLIGHNSLNLLDPSIASLDLTQLRNESLFLCVNESNQSAVVIRWSHDDKMLDKLLNDSTYLSLLGVDDVIKVNSELEKESDIG